MTDVISKMSAKLWKFASWHLSKGGLYFIMRIQLFLEYEVAMSVFTSFHITSVFSSGLTKQFNPQRTIEEATEESDDDIMVSNRSRQKPSKSHHVTKSRDKPAKASGFEIVDSDEDDDDVVVTPKKISAKAGRESSTKKKDSRDERSTKKNQSSSNVSAKKGREIVESEDDSDEDVVVTPSKSSRGAQGSKGSSSKYNKRK